MKMMMRQNLNLSLDTTLRGYHPPFSKRQSPDTAGWPSHRSTAAGPRNSTWLASMPTSATTHSTLRPDEGIVLSRQSTSSNDKEC